MHGLYALKPGYTARLSRIVAAAERAQVSPDVFTAIGCAAAAAAGAALWQGWWIAAGMLLAARLAGANLDGAVARARGVSRPWGFVLNEVGDRSSDLLMFAGLAAFAYRTAGSYGVSAVLLAALAATLPTFASLAAAGAGAGRRNGGPFGKTERCVYAVVVCAFPSWLTGLCALVVLGSVVTAGARLRAALGELSAAAVTVPVAAR